MIDGSNSYPTYRAFGLNPDARVPAHWDVKRAKYLKGAIARDASIEAQGHVEACTPDGRRHSLLTLEDGSTPKRCRMP